MTGFEGDKGGSSVIDFSSPYYLHPSDSPKQPSVNEKPETSSSEYKSWMRCDVMIKRWLATTMEKGIRDSVKYANTSSEIWSDMKERFGKESAPRAYEWKKKITTTRQEGSSVSTYYPRLRGVITILDPRKKNIWPSKKMKTNKTTNAPFVKNRSKREGCFKLASYPDWWPMKKDDKAKPKAAYVETGTSPIPGLNEGHYQEFVKFFSRSSNNVEAKSEANMAINKDDGLRTRSLIRSGKCQGGYISWTCSRREDEPHYKK
nr:hypothetical protein [Tanacetum cinerariifolium]